MANYLLLRNNKESGPHSLDDLMELGLKPYDLVWVQGKSAAWRYPSEVDELRPFAPVVEEQPFDRFYKKHTETTKQEFAPLQEQFVPQKQDIQAIAPEHEKYIPKKSVFVTMPGQKTNTIKPETNTVKPAIKEQTYKASVPEPMPASQTISVTENPVAAQVKYAQPLDEIKEMYVKTLYDRKQKIARKGFWLQGLKKAAVILLLVAVGLIAGLIIKSNGNSDQKEIVRDNTAAETSKAITTDTSLDTQEINTLQPESKIIPPPNGGFVNAPPEREAAPTESGSLSKNDPVDNEKKETTQLLVKNNESSSAALSPGVETDPATGERSRKVRKEGTRGNSTNTAGGNADVKSFRDNEHLTGMVSVTSNEYKKVAFGGIRNLELTITNDSKYTLDKVLVELQYLKPSEQPLKTENVEFKSVGPKASSTLKIPDTNRGIKVTYRIINIKSREMDELASGN